MVYLHADQRCLIDEFEFPIQPTCNLVLGPQLEAIDLIALDKGFLGGGSYNGKVHSVLIASPAFY